MIRVNFHLTDDQLKRLRAESERTGLTVAELIRRAVDAHLVSEDRKRQRRREK